MASVSKRPKTSGTFTISSSIFLNEELISKNKLYEYDDDWTWIEVLKDISNFIGCYATIIECKLPVPVKKEDEEKGSH
jgi:hypothetical protein